MQTVIVNKGHRPPAGAIKLPGSKSESNRILIIRHLAQSDCIVHNLSRAEDTVILEKCLDTIVQANQGTPLTIDAGDAGTCYRFLTALLAITPGKFLLTGSDRMKCRPVGILAEALKQLGADIVYQGAPGYPPLLIRGLPLQGGEVKVPGGVSSQFISALLLIAPVLPEGLIIRSTGEPVSAPYIDLTLEVMRKSGVEVVRDGRTYIVRNKTYQGNDYIVEPDWSSAAFWYELLALCGSGELLLPGLSANSFQGDRVAVELYRRLGIETSFEHSTAVLRKGSGLDSIFSADLGPYPDLAPSLAVACAGLNIEAELSGLGNLRIKESDRLAAIEAELNRLGFHAEAGKDRLMVRTVIPASPGLRQVVNTCNDHRIAMAFAPLAWLMEEIEIENPLVVRKSYPGFWDDLESAGAVVTFRER